MKEFAAPEEAPGRNRCGQAGEPVTPLIFGGYMEPATTRVWAEMLTDRKFANPVTVRAAAGEFRVSPLSRATIQARGARRNG